jgi:hypothetical protein
MRHSPWPWRVTGSVSPIVLDAGGREVAILSGDRSNARLIAHAPDLLDLAYRLRAVESWGEAERLREFAEDLIRDCGEVP